MPVLPGQSLLPPAATAPNSLKNYQPQQLCRECLDPTVPSPEFPFTPTAEKMGNAGTIFRPSLLASLLPPMIYLSQGRQVANWLEKVQIKNRAKLLQKSAPVVRSLGCPQDESQKQTKGRLPDSLKPQPRTMPTASCPAYHRTLARESSNNNPVR